MLYFMPPLKSQLNLGLNMLNTFQIHQNKMCSCSLFSLENSHNLSRKATKVLYVKAIMLKVKKKLNIIKNKKMVGCSYIQKQRLGHTCVISLHVLE